MERSFFEIFEGLEDPRNEKGKVYPLIDVVILAIYGVLIGFTDFANMSYYLKKREKEMKEGLGLAEGVPSHDVFSDVFRVLDVERFMSLFVEWTRQLAYAKTGKHIAIDGKAVRAATKKAAKGKIPYVVSAFMCDCGLSIGQKEVGEKTNEITEIPKLLDLIDINGCFVTIDAIGTQTEIMDKIVDKGGHFCLQLKKNQRTAFDDVSLFFEDMENYYLYAATSERRPDKRYPVSVQTYIGKITVDGIVSERVSINVGKTVVPGVLYLITQSGITAVSLLCIIA